MFVCWCVSCHNFCNSLCVYIYIYIYNLSGINEICQVTETTILDRSSLDWSDFGRKLIGRKTVFYCCDLALVTRLKWQYRESSTYRPRAYWNVFLPCLNSKDDKILVIIYEALSSPWSGRTHGADSGEGFEVNRNFLVLRVTCIHMPWKRRSALLSAKDVFFASPC